MIGERLKEERERLGYTQDNFSAAAGAKRRTLVDWERNASSPTAVQLSALADIGVDVQYVVTGMRSQGSQPLFTWEDIGKAGHGMLYDAALIKAITIDSEQTYNLLHLLLMKNLTKVTGIEEPSSDKNAKIKAG
jgi:transcriptional regulator with XRE-family HTH domain